MSTPHAIQARVARVAEACLDAALRQHRSPLWPDIQTLSALFTADRGARARTYMRDPALRRAYLAFWVPHNVARLAGVLARAAGEGLLGDAPPRVLDLGAGPLSGVLAAWCVFGRVTEATAVDLSGPALSAGRDVLRELGADVGAVALHDAAVNGPPNLWWPKVPVDLVILANVLNELSDPRQPDQRRRIVDTALRALAPGGRLLITEPAMRVEARSLMSVRDELVADGVPVLSPCIGAAASTCPLNDTRGDWCHQDVRWPGRPARYVELEERAGLPKERLAVAHLLVAGPDDAPAAPPPALRVIGGVMRDARGTERRYLCGDALVTIAGRPRLPPPVAAAARGDLIAARAVRDLIDDDRPRRGPTREPGEATRAPRGRLERNARAGGGRSPPPVSAPTPAQKRKKKPPAR